MNKIYLNELSLNGQFDSIEEFLDSCIPLIKCLKFIKDNKRNVYKHSAFFRQHITKDILLNDLRGVCSDKARRLKSLLLSTTDTPPFWDLDEELKQDLTAVYMLNGNEITATSIAEAAEEDGILLSFLHDKYRDVILPVYKNGKMLKEIGSAVSLNYLSEQLWKKKQIDIHKYVRARYDGTRLNFSMLEEEYGFIDFEKEELRDCLQAFDKFIKHETWEEVAKDRGLYYKKYVPQSTEKDWFRQEEYREKEIYKFRCGNPKRCFGYRERDTFYVLRMERDHKISDYG